MTSLPTQPYKGTRDYYPDDKRVQNYMFNTWRKVAESFGYEEYGAPMVESLDIYAAKTGQEIVNEQTYQFVDRGGRHVTIRPEMTPSVSRMVANKRQELAYPARWYSIANFMRYERPQHGREREFWQLNTDIFGVATVDAEAEMIQLADALMKAFGAETKMYEIRVNDRKLINYMMAEYLQLDAVQTQLMVKLFDRKGKIAHEDFRDQAADIFGEGLAEEGLKKIAGLLGAKTMADLPAEIRDSQAVKEIQSFFTLLTEAGISNAKFDISLMRGLDYYTGIVFEIFDTHPDNNRALFGGGRYDGLISLFGAESIPMVGMAPGATTMEDFLRAHKLLPNLSSTTEVYMIPLGEVRKGAQRLATKLRKEGVNVEIDLSDRKIDKRIKVAAKKQIPFLLFVGEKEIDEEVYKLKNVKNEHEQSVSFERVVSTVKDLREHE